MKPQTIAECPALGSADSKQSSSDAPINISEAAAYLNITPSALYKLASKDGFPCYKPFGKLLFFRTELRAYVQSSRHIK